MMVIRNSDEAMQALYDYFVDTLVDLYDPEEGEEQETRDDMLNVVSVLFEGLSIEAQQLDDGTIHFTANL